MASLDRLRHTIGSTVRRLRSERRWTLAELAPQLHLSESRLSELERGGGSFSAEHLLAIFRLFHVGPEDFVGADEAHDPIVGSLQTALARFGAHHLAISDSFVIRREHRRPLDAVQEVLIGHPNARLLTALPPVLIGSLGEIPLSAIQHAVVQAGVPHRWAWLLDQFLAALDELGSDSGSTKWRRDSQRARTVAQHFLSAVPRPPDDASFDILDPELRSLRSVKLAEAHASPVDIRWRVLSRLGTPDFVGPLEVIRDAL